MAVFVGTIGLGLALWLLASVLLGLRIVQRDEQQAAADAIAVAATTIALREGSAAVCDHPAMQRLLENNIIKHEEWEGEAPCPEMERIAEGEDGAGRLRYRSSVRGRVSNPYERTFDEYGGDDVEHHGTAQIREQEFEEVEERRPKLMLVLDYSGSMSIEFGGGSRTDSLRRAVTQLLDQELRVEYGLVMFTDRIVNTIPIDDDPRQRDIVNAINDRGPGGGTKYGGPIGRATNMLRATEDTG